MAFSVHPCFAARIIPFCVVFRFLLIAEWCSDELIRAAGADEDHGAGVDGGAAGGGDAADAAVER